MKKHLFISETDDALYDTRKPKWYELPALRPDFRKVIRDCENNSHAIRAAIRAAYCFPGGYELIGLTSDGGTLCNKCMRAEYHQIAYSVRHKINDGWRVVAIDQAGNYDELTCDHCGTVICGPEDEEVDQ